jgi:REP element-mobilizing transposase RayT
LDAFDTSWDRQHEAPGAEPLGFLITWTTYGTWLPGDERGWVQRGAGLQKPDLNRKREAAAQMTEHACVLDPKERGIVEETIAEHCRKRGWKLHAANCRTNHVHVVVSASASPEDVRDQFKAWCTRRLKESERTRREASTISSPRLTLRSKWWTEKGSARMLWDDFSLQAAIKYVREGQ